MSFLRFFGMSCLVFVIVGPLVPMPALGIHVALSTGDFSKLSGLVGATLVLSPWSYLVGGVLAIQFGAIFAGLIWLLDRAAPRIIPRRSAVARTAFGTLLGAAIGFAYVAPAVLSGIVRRRQYPPYSDDLSLALAVWWRYDAPSSFAFFILPSALSAAVVSLWLIPKWMANGRFERTSRKRRENPAPPASARSS